MNNSISGASNSGSVGQNSFYQYKKKNVVQGQGPFMNSSKKVDKKKVLPVTKKFPELKLMINGEQRNHNNSFSSDEENFNVSGTSSRLCLWLKLVYSFYLSVNSSHRSKSSNSNNSCYRHRNQYSPHRTTRTRHSKPPR